MACLSKKNGFTLLEILVAVAITAVILSLIYGSFSSSFAVSEQIKENLDFYRTVRISLGKMTRELENAFWMEEEGDATFLFVGTDEERDGYPRDSLRFTSLSHYRSVRNAPESQFNVLGYFLEEDPERSILLLMHQEEVSLYSLTPRTVKTFELGEGLHGLDFQYYDGKEWFPVWDADIKKTLPKAVRLKVILQDSRGKDRVFATTATLGLAQ